MVTKEELEEYRSKKAEIKELESTLLQAGGELLFYKERLEELKMECQIVEGFIESIEDSQLRRMFRMRFMEGLNMFTIGNRLYMDKSTVSRRISRFFGLQRTQRMQPYNKNHRRTTS